MANKRGRPPKHEPTAEELLQAEQMACLGEAKKLREMLMEQAKKLIERVDAPDVPTDTRLEVVSGLGGAYTQLIKAAETVGKYAKATSSESEGSLEDLLRP